MAPTITTLDCGTVHLDKSILTDGVDRGTVIGVPSLCFVVEATDTILVDTSFGDPDRMTELHYPTERGPDRTLPAQLNAAGYAVDDVDAVLLTHLHWDHCYNLDRFAEVPIYVQRAELAYAIAPYGMHAVPYEAKAIGRTPPWLDADLTAVEGEVELCPGVTAFPTPGHAVGLQAVAVERGSETVVIAGDAIPTAENLAGTETSRFVPGGNVNAIDWWKSAEAIVDRADVVLPGHEDTRIDLPG